MNSRARFGAAAALLLSGLLITVSMLQPAQAIETDELEDPAQQVIYRELVDELRCLVCQNQNLADSNAELAIDLRREIRDMLVAGDGKRTIVDFMVARYGEFVLYKPRISLKTLALWAGPFLFLLVGLLVVYRLARHSKEVTVADEDALKRARKLLGDAQINSHTASPSAAKKPKV